MGEKRKRRLRRRVDLIRPPRGDGRYGRKDVRNGGRAPEEHRIKDRDSRILYVNGVLTMNVAEAELQADGDLLARAQGGEVEAREELARRHRRVAYLFALQLTGNPDDALDVSQDALLRLFKHLPRLDRARPVRPWLLTVVRNRANDLWRRKKVRRDEPLAVEVGPDLGHQIVDPAADPETDASRGQSRRRVWGALQSLSAAHREILVLRDYHDLRYAEIAEVLSIPVGTVMSRLHAARKSLRAAYLQATRSES